MKHLFLALLLRGLISCGANEGIDNTGSDNGKTNSSEASINPTEDVSGCYMKIIGRDTAILMLEQKGRDLSGKRP